MDTKAITVRLPVDIYERLRLRAFEERTSQAAIITDAVREKLDREAGRASRTEEA